jgi:SAM-dependent MidA family methyltransferase
MGVTCLFRATWRWLLYQAGSGYYSAGAHKLGSGGDFTTAPEISPFFGMALTNAILPVLEAYRSQGKPTRILEFGAGTGKLAASILGRLRELDFPLDHYGILEIAPDLAQRQRTLLEEIKKRTAVFNRNRVAQHAAKPV